jgi:hypothetical protein
MELTVGLSGMSALKPSEDHILVDVDVRCDMDLYSCSYIDIGCPVIEVSFF